MLIYNLFTIFLKAGLWLSFPFSAKLRSFRQKRRGLFTKIEQTLTRRDKDSRTFWFHCASLGEFEQGRPVIEQVRKLYPDTYIVLSFFSPSGYETRQHYAVADLVCYLPLDGRSNAKKFINLVKPDMAFFVKYEFWYGYLSTLKQRNIPSVSFSAIFRPDAIPFCWYGGFYRKTLRQIDHYFVQDEASAKLLNSVGIQGVTLAGDTRFDRVADICREAKSINLAKLFKQKDKIMVIGSSWPEDMEVLLPFMQKFVDDIKFIVAPHKIEEEELSRIEHAIPYKTVRFSNARESTVSNYRILLIDNIGMLTSLYQYGAFAYVGGAFGKSLHNILEPATFGMPIYFGNKSYRHFNEANTLLKLGVASTVSDAKDFCHKFLLYHQDEEKREAIAEICRTYVAENTGATNIIMDYVQQTI